MKVNPIVLIFSFSLWLLIILIATLYYFWWWLNEPVNLPENLSSYEVTSGMSVNSIAKDFNRHDFIRWPEVWALYARLANKTRVKKGEYQFSIMESPRSILYKLNSGNVVQYQVTFVEGMTFKELVDELNRIESKSPLLSYEQALKQLQEKDLQLNHPEGWFFPDTYSYTKSDSRISILIRAHKKMKRILEELWQTRDIDLPYDNPYQALTMASIIEKETGAPHERREIAGVFVRRLLKNMRLQTDPTVIYGMGEDYKGNITRKDLKQSTPYNTYVIFGLPPTPIAMPGREAIFAALHPEQGNTLFFVAKGDGTHKFSATLEEHNQAVREYQLKRRENYRSSFPK